MVCGQVGTQSLPDRHKDLIDALRSGDAAAARRATEHDLAQGMRLGEAGLFGRPDSIDSD